MEKIIIKNKNIRRTKIHMSNSIRNVKLHIIDTLLTSVHDSRRCGGVVYVRV